MTFVQLLIVTVLASVPVQVQGHTQRDITELVDISLYDGDDIDEFLGICVYPDYEDMYQWNRVEKDREEFDAYWVGAVPYNNSVKPNITKCLPLHLGQSSQGGKTPEEERAYCEKRFLQLRNVQRLIRDYHKIVTTDHNYTVFVLLVFCIGAGIYLVAVGHYHWRSIIDPFHLDGSNGVPCWQYLRMRYVAARVRKNTKDKTLFVPIFEDKSKKKAKQPRESEMSADMHARESASSQKQ